MLKQREKLKRKKLEIELKMVDNAMNQMLNQVAISERATAQMVEWLKVGLLKFHSLFLSRLP